MHRARQFFVWQPWADQSPCEIQTKQPGERFMRCQSRCLISTESTRGEYFEILFHSHNSRSLYLYVPTGFRSHEANMEFNELYT